MGKVIRFAKEGAEPGEMQGDQVVDLLGNAVGDEEEDAESRRQAELQADLDDQRFLGREFLTWLVFHVDTAEGIIGTGKDKFTLGFGDRVLLRSLAAEVGEMRVKGEAPADSADLRYAIAGGLTLREAELLLVKGKRSFKLTLGAEGFDLRSVKLPTELGGDGPSGATERGGRGRPAPRPADDDALDEARTEVKVQERLELLEELDGLMAAAYDVFLEARLSPRWTSETVPALRDWLIESLSE
jgi:hypothetical protein